MWCRIFTKVIKPGSVLMLSILIKMYLEQLLSYEIDEASHTNRFKDRLLNSVPNLSSLCCI